jgi:hypothetical protein
MSARTGGHGRRIGSPVGRLIAVADTAADAEAARQGLVAAGVDVGAIETLSGLDAAAAFDVSGRRHGVLGRLFRILEFTWADQAPDFAWYEAAVRGGRTVLIVRVRGQRHVAHAARIIEEAGGHFINYFGLFETQELARWTGKEPDVPGFLRR